MIYKIAEKKCQTQEIDAWKEYGNNKTFKINWQFAIADARIKLKRLYPSFDN